MSCNSCRRKSYIDTNKSGLLATLALIVLPKCPFCVLAYSSTIAMCSLKPGKESHGQNLLISISIVTVCALIICYSIIHKKNKSKSILAIPMVLCGFGLVITALLVSNTTIFYYLGILIIVFGIWMSGSLISFTQYVKSLLFKSQIKNLKYK